MSGIAPIVGRLQKALIMDLSLAVGFGLGMGYTFWYTYHVPAVRSRDIFYAKLEQQRIANAQQ